MIWIIKRDSSLIEISRKSAKYIRITTLIVFGFINTVLFKGCFPDQKISFDLTSPLKNGDYYIVQGGTPPLMNQGHYNNNRLDRYSIDFVKLNAFGLSINKINPKQVDDFVIFNDSIFSPCDGEVIRVEQENECNRDLKKIQNDSIEHRVNNIVVIRTNGAVLILSHLKKGSIELEIGQKIKQSDYIGLISNSGAIEPHLHMQMIKRNEAIPFRIDGRYLHNNSIIRDK